ncbi:hypothetical protein K491DRAFT_687486 [Lophiostoma macrostomum CBS 122681]|uniref:Uncharacterized protein n=1 Tax=Lophiostoma macrostomum CBS 122681 TaxID=1314788 RepID=A0A6A6TQT8_9PLEO|nr:hypothetical protein K491DRAFT_687486 [Lophiostoma macrostomum CBS 122681]
MIGRKIILTEQTDLHLLWCGRGIFVKRLPKFLLCSQFCEEHLIDNPKLRGIALGLLISYTWLIAHESDFEIAVERRVMPLQVSWLDWKGLVRTLLDKDYGDWVDKRYTFGELRLSRINLIYRLMPGVNNRSLFRGYYNEYSEYSAFFRNNFSWMIAVFALVTTVLAAMQVGLGTDRLKSSNFFQNASVGFAIFAIQFPFIVIGGGLFLFAILFLYNLITTVLIWERRRGEV